MQPAYTVVLKKAAILWGLEATPVEPETSAPQRLRLGFGDVRPYLGDRGTVHVSGAQEEIDAAKDVGRLFSHSVIHAGNVLGVTQCSVPGSGQIDTYFVPVTCGVKPHIRYDETHKTLTIKTAPVDADSFVKKIRGGDLTAFNILAAVCDDNLLSTKDFDPAFRAAEDFEPLSRDLSKFPKVLDVWRQERDALLAPIVETLNANKAARHLPKDVVPALARVIMGNEHSHNRAAWKL